MALHANSGVSGDASVLALTKGALADFAISLVSRILKNNSAWQPVVISYLALVIVVPIKGAEISFSHVSPHCLIEQNRA